MKAAWEERPLGEVSTYLNRGVSPTYLEDGGICVLNQKCIRDHAVSFALSRRHDAAAKAVAPERIIQEGDVLVNSTGTGTLGRVAQLREAPPEPTTVDSHVTIVRPKKDLIHSDFFGYMLVAIEEQLQAGGEGCGGQTELARAVLAERYRVRYPCSKDEQIRIVGIFDKAFEGIAEAKANTQRNLENTHAVFRAVRHEVLERRDDGWRDVTLNEVAENLDSRRVPVTKTAREPGPYPYYGASGVVDHVAEFIFDEETLLISEDGANLLSRTTPIAFVARGKYWVNNHAHILRFRSSITQRFVEEYIESISIKAYVTGTAQPKLTQKALYQIPIPLPRDEATQAEIVAKLDELREVTNRAAALYERKLAALDELKKSLLHHAFAGAL